MVTRRFHEVLTYAQPCLRAVSGSGRPAVLASIALILGLVSYSYASPLIPSGSTHSPGYLDTAPDASQYRPDLSSSNPTVSGMGSQPQTTAAGGDAVTADANEDGFVDVLDLLVVIREFGAPTSDGLRADVNADGEVDVLDLAVVARYLGRLAPQPLRAMRVQRAFPNLTFGRLTNLIQPDDGHDHNFVTEQEGRILAFSNDQAATQVDTFLDISVRVRTSNLEEGLLGLAFDTNYGSNGYFYVYYSASNPRRSVLSRFSVSGDSPNVADPGSEYVIMEIAQPFGNHNGGQLAFGPDGYLYIALGDGGSGGDPQGERAEPRHAAWIHPAGRCPRRDWRQQISHSVR